MPFTAQTRMSGVDLSTPDGARQVRKGAASAVISWVREHGGTIPPRTGELVDGISASGGTPLLVGELVGGTARVLGITQLTDVVKQGCGGGSTRCAGWASAP